MNKHTPGWTDIVFDGPPGPESGRFVEVEDEKRASLSVGEWVERNDGYWCLRLPANASLMAAAPAMLRVLQRIASTRYESVQYARDQAGALLSKIGKA